MTTPSTALPSSLTYGVFKGELLRAVTDTALDIDDLPDRVGCTGTFTLTPSIASVKLVAEEITLFLEPIKIELDKANGTGKFSGTVLATDNPAMDQQDWHYIVSAQVDGGTIKSFPIFVPTGSVQDFSTVAPIEVSPGIFITKGDPGVSIASAETVDGLLVLTLSDETVLPGVEMPGGTTVDLTPITARLDAINPPDKGGLVAAGISPKVNLLEQPGDWTLGGGWSLGMSQMGGKVTHPFNHNYGGPPSSSTKVVTLPEDPAGFLWPMSGSLPDGVTMSLGGVDAVQYDGLGYLFISVPAGEATLTVSCGDYFYGSIEDTLLYAYMNFAAQKVDLWLGANGNTNGGLPVLYDNGTFRIGTLLVVDGNFTSIGYGTAVGEAGSTEVGSGANAYGASSTAIGSNAFADEDYEIALGTDANTTRIDGLLRLSDTTVPTTDPPYATGGVMYADGGSLYWRGSNGTVVEMSAPAIDLDSMTADFVATVEAALA